MLLVRRFLGAVTKMSPEKLKLMLTRKLAIHRISFILEVVTTIFNKYSNSVIYMYQIDIHLLLLSFHQYFIWPSINFSICSSNFWRCINQIFVFGLFHIVCVHSQIQNPNWLYKVLNVIFLCLIVIFKINFDILVAECVTYQFAMLSIWYEFFVVIPFWNNLVYHL